MPRDQIKTYRLLTKDRREVIVPRSGNHLKATQQNLGYGVGMTLGLASAILLEPLIDLAKDTHIARGIEHGWVNAHRKVDVAKYRMVELRSTTRDELVERCVSLGYCTAEDAEKMTHGQLARLYTEKEIPPAYEPTDWSNEDLYGEFDTSAFEGRGKQTTSSRTPGPTRHAVAV
jgi:hypothetical protein